MAQIHQAESKGRTPIQSERAESQNSQWLSQLAILAIVGQMILLASAWLLPAVSEYGLVGDHISELAIGRFGFIQTAAFLISGLGTLGLAYAMRKLTKGIWGSQVGPLLIAIYSLGAILAAIFPTDRIDSATDLSALSTAGTIHILVAAISFLSMIVGMFILVRTFGLAPGWRPIRLWSVFFPAGALALFIVQGQGPLVGILQRALVTLISGWITLVALRVRQIARTVELKTSGEK